MTEQIIVSKDSFEAARAYIKAALKADPATQPMTMARDLHRALECMNEALLPEEEIRGRQ